MLSGMNDESAPFPSTGPNKDACLYVFFPFCVVLLETLRHDMDITNSMME